MTCYLADATICATAEIAARSARNNVSENNPRAWLGPDASWTERLLFDWAYLEATCRLSVESAPVEYSDCPEIAARHIAANTEMAQYARSRITALLST